MSADNGYILRIDKNNRYCLQQYFASVGYPKISQTAVHMRFRDIGSAIYKFEKISKEQTIEYGLSVDISDITDDEHENGCPIAQVHTHMLKAYEPGTSVDTWMVATELLNYVKSLGENARCTCEN